MAKCTDCTGTGYILTLAACAKCHGSGEIVSYSPQGEKKITKCDSCDWGRVYVEEVCDACEGTGIV